jgi:hypothetical protein
MQYEPNNFLTWVSVDASDRVGRKPCFPRRGASGFNKENTSKVAKVMLAKAKVTRLEEGRQRTHGNNIVGDVCMVEEDRPRQEGKLKRG